MAFWAVLVFWVVLVFGVDFEGAFLRDTVFAATFFTADFLVTDLPDAFFFTGLRFETDKAFWAGFAAFFAGFLVVDFFAFFLVAICDLSLKN